MNKHEHDYEQEAAWADGLARENEYLKQQERFYAEAGYPPERYAHDAHEAIMDLVPYIKSGHYKLTPDQHEAILKTLIILGTMRNG